MNARLIVAPLLAALWLQITLTPAQAATFPVTYEDVSATHLPLATLGNNSMDALPADLDGDGDLDIVVASEFRPNVILINDGTGHFTNESAARIAQPSHDSEDIGIADLDLDGDLDIVFVSEDDQINELYLNDGSGFFSDASDRIPTAGTSNAVLLVFVNDDAFPDIIIGNAGQNVILINDGTAHFTDETSTRLPVNLNVTQDLEWGDVDGDGDSDLVEGNENGNRLLRNDGTGVFTDVTAGNLPLPPAGEETREADLGDVDGDEDLDLFLANVTFAEGRPSQNRLLLNNGSGVFVDVTATHLPAAQQNTVDGDFIDLDYDEDLDIATAQAFDGTYQIFLNDGLGHFTDHTSDLFQTSPTGNGIDVEAADFTGDGFLDLYLTGFQRTDYLFRGIVDPTSTVGHGDTGSLDLRLHLNGPNPTRSSARVGLSLQQSAHVTLRVVDVTGAEMGVVVNRRLGPGSYEYEWSAQGFAAGRYYWYLEAGADALSRGFVLVR